MKHTNKTPIAEDQLAWLSVRGFIDLYLDCYDPEFAFRVAYEKAEEKYQSVFKRRRYANYQSFLVSKWKYHRRLIKAKEQKSK